MIQGTGSDVGKSVIVAGLCRIAKRRNISVAPFKPQNMSNNAAACADGGEIGRAQALQAMAAGLPPQVDFNPVLLKPQTDKIAQVVVHGHARSALSAAKYMGSRDSLLPSVLESFDRLTTRYDLIVVEGAGSPAETNLRERDIANMGFARAAGVPVCLIGDIERGGVIASVVGTHVVIDPDDAAMIRGFAINKFRGDVSLFDDGVKTIERATGWRNYGVIPWLTATSQLPAEDAVNVTSMPASVGRPLRVAAPMLSRMANFDDADPLKMEPEVDFQFVPPGKALPTDVDLIILFGSKSTLGDLQFMREQGWDHDIIAHNRNNGRVLGICGGYQMLGKKITDIAGIDDTAGEAEGLGLLDVETVMSSTKSVRPVAGVCASTGAEVNGYEIHVGETTGADCARPLLEIAGHPEGARSADGRVEGTYVHGLLNSDAYRQRFLRRQGKGFHTAVNYSAAVERALDSLADGLEAALDIDLLLGSSRPIGWHPDDE